MATLVDLIILSLASFLGNVGVSLTGFGMAIIYIFFWQLTELCGYGGDFKYAIFIQAVALLSAQPLLLYKVDIKKHASRQMLLYFIPITIIATPLGQITSEYISTDAVKGIGGILVMYIASFELYKKRSFFLSCLRLAPPSSQVANVKGKIDLNDIEKGLNTSTRNNAFETTEITTGLDTSENSLGLLYQEDSNNKSYSFFEIYSLSNEVLGEGSFSVVKVGASLYTGTKVAVKLVTKSKLLKQEEEAIEREVELLKTISHPKIVQFKDCFDELGLYYIVQEKMDGSDLLDRLNQVTYFSEKEAKSICKSITEALHYLHSQKICHRDVKLENILFSSGQNRRSETVKLSDFGFAKHQAKDRDYFRTLCGTLSYIAPEILLSKPYNFKVDAWSLGIVAFTIMAGYQPFNQEDEEALKQLIVKSDFCFDDEFWGDFSENAKGFITNLLRHNPNDRMSTEIALNHQWFKAVDNADNEKQHEVFFMIGSQRSGSNWLRTMLDEREDLAGPHPPHMMRDFMPIIDKFGDLRDDANFRILVDHLCSFVENNQVPWTDRHGHRVRFIRNEIYMKAAASCKRVQLARAATNETPKQLNNEIYLLSIFDAIMEFFTRSCGKRTWICKSMGMSKFHNTLLEFYGEKRLRYIYLVRDPRDVAMSFMKTPVGDCHFHPIATKWTNLQYAALKVLDECPNLVHRVHYEQILKAKAKVLKEVYSFIGERRLCAVKRQASVLQIKPVEKCVDSCKNGQQAKIAMRLSYQFKNLGRGDSFITEQFRKWANPKTGLKDEDLIIIESVAKDVMEKLGYETHLVGKTHKRVIYTKDDLASFAQANKLAIKAMNDTLKVENPGDFERRKVQAKVLTFAPELLNDWAKEDEMKNSQFISEKELDSNLRIDTEKSCLLENKRRIRWGIASQKGYYPLDKTTRNQDSVAVYSVDTGNGKKQKWFSVLDGHGHDGDKCSQFVAKHLPELYEDAIKSRRVEKKNSMLDSDSRTTFPGMALHDSHSSVDRKLSEAKDIDCVCSGTTVSSVIFDEEDKCLISNLGDSSCILGQKRNGKIIGHKLVTEHNLFDEEELERVKRTDAIIMTVEEKDGLDFVANTPPRIWHSDPSKSPGVAFTRSIGDTLAHNLGVISQPEVFEHTLSNDDRFIILCSDGLTEWMDEEECVNIVCQHSNPSDAATALVKTAREHWMNHTDYIDDITIIVIFLQDDSILEDRFNNDAIGYNMEKKSSITVADADNENTSLRLSNAAIFWTLFAGAASGYLGGLCGIRGPPLILYFLHPPFPITFTKESQRATGACITVTNVLMRVVFYFIESFFLSKGIYFVRSDWTLYLSVVLCSIFGVVVGTMLFEKLSDSKDTIRGILTIMLVLCGISLLLSSYT